MPSEIKRQSKKLLVPYFFFELINLIFSYMWCFVSNDRIQFKSAIISILICIDSKFYPGPVLRLWFLPSMFVSLITMWAIRRYIPNNKIKLLIAVLLFYLSWILSIIYDGRLPFTLDISIMATAFIVVGYVAGWIIKKLLNNELPSTLVIISVIISIVVYVICIISNPSTIYMYINEYGNYFYAIIGAISGSWIVIVFGRVLWLALSSCHFRSTGALKSIVLWYGNNSLVAFPVHIEIKLFIRKFVEIVFGETNWGIEFVFTLLVTIPICNFITHYIPFILGNNRRKHRDR